MSAPDPQVRIATLEGELYWAQLKIQVLEERLRKQRILMLGPQSETLSNLQLELLADEEPGTTAEELEAETRREAVAKMPHASASRIRARTITRKSATCGESDFLSGSDLQCLRQRNSGDRQRRERATRRRAGAVLRSHDLAGKARLPQLRTGYGDDGAAGTAHHRKGSG